MRETIKTFWDFIDARSVVRRVVLMVTLWMTWHSYIWATHYADHFYKMTNGTDLAVVIAAVLAPIMALQGFVFKVYTEGRV